MMYYKNLLTTIYITLVVSVTTTTAAVTNLTGLPPNFPQTYPTLDTPPEPVAPWTALVDKSKLPAAPVNLIGYPCAAVDTFCHQIGIHTWSHTQLTTQSTDTIIAELKYTETLIKNVTNLTPKLMRPPTGDLDDRVRGIARQLGYKIALWNHDTFDWKSFGDPKYDLNWITDNFTIWAQNKSTIGVISLEHDLYNISSSKIPDAIDIIIKYNYTSKQISNCVPNTPAYVENVTLPMPDAVSSSPSGTNTNSPKKSSAEIHVPGFLAIIVSILVITGSIFIKLD
ncbi:7983_t:CDS:2 [Scutellospora calospora]|uniref:7983_t:CDS:1 n=1 Tax=Scutellospora calospora TaxID=85575 RepID=A0ACA9KQB8_9GLOM|nr:7983_t:CDS:2 [Scutellospora calospora]